MSDEKLSGKFSFALTLEQSLRWDKLAKWRRRSMAEKMRKAFDDGLTDLELQHENGKKS